MVPRRSQLGMVPLSEKRDLETRTVFGTHRVYRAPDRDTELERAARVGEVGCELLTAVLRHSKLKHHDSRTCRRVDTSANAT